MATTITDTAMWSDVTGVRAEYRPHAAAGGRGAWVITGDPRLAGRLLDRNAAATAMTLAEFEAAGQGDSPHAASWRSELGLAENQPTTPPAEGP